MQHIREKLPDIKARLNTLMGQTQQELASYGEPQFSAPQHRGSLILQLMTRFATSFVSSIDGTSSEISTKELCGGARIYYIFNSVFGHSLDSIDPTQNLTVHDIRTAIRNSTGPRPSLFVPEMAFDLLVKPQIRLLESPSQRCVELVYEELMKICHNCGNTEITRFPRLQTKLIEVVSELLRERLGPTSRYVESLIAIQGAYINTNHPNFLGATGAMNSMMNNNQNVTKTKRREASAIRTRERSVMGERVNGLSPKLESPTDNLNGSATSIGGATHDNQHSAGSQPHHHVRTDSHSVENGVVTAATNARETFLNYFFGNNKDGAMENSVVMPRATESRLYDHEKRQRRNRENSKAVDMNSFTRAFEEAEIGVTFPNFKTDFRWTKVPMNHLSLKESEWKLI
jgi:dynamin 1-like protein